MYTLEVLNPVSQKEGDIQVAKPASRPSTLDGLTLGLVWNAKRGGLDALAKAGELISNKYKEIKVQLYEGSQPCKEGLLEQAKQECDIIVGSTGD